MQVKKTDNILADALNGILALKAYFKEIGMPTSLKELNVSECDLEALAYNTMFKGKRTLQDIVEVDYDLALKIYKDAM